jgi:hypothetical protein
LEGCPKVVTLPNETRLFSFGEGIGSRTTFSLANGDDRSGEYDFVSTTTQDILEDDSVKTVSRQADSAA